MSYNLSKKDWCKQRLTASWCDYNNDEEYDNWLVH